MLKARLVPTIVFAQTTKNAVIQEVQQTLLQRIKSLTIARKKYCYE